MAPSNNSLMVADMIGKLLSIQQNLTASSSENLNAHLEHNINDLHLRVDNLYRSISRTALPASVHPGSATSQDLIIFSPTEQFHQDFTNARFVKTTELNSLPWLKINHSPLKNRDEQRVRKRIGNGNGNGNGVVKKNRAVLANMSGNRSSTRSGPGSIAAEALHKKKFKELGRLPEQGNSEAVENVGNAEDRPSLASVFSFSSLVHRPKPALSFPTVTPQGVRLEEIKEN